MNPDIYQAARTGAPLVTVYVTASEISGNGGTPEQKARSLQRGVQDAYARMAGVTDADPNGQEKWTGQAWTIGTRQVERYSLRDRPSVQLVFMNLHDAKLGDVYDDGLVDQTVIPTGATVTKSYSYAKSDVVDVLAAIITSYQPSVLRYQDPLPDEVRAGPLRPLRRVPVHRGRRRPLHRSADRDALSRLQHPQHDGEPHPGCHQGQDLLLRHLPPVRRLRDAVQLVGADVLPVAAWHPVGRTRLGRPAAGVRGPQRHRQHLVGGGERQLDRPRRRWATRADR